MPSNVDRRGITLYYTLVRPLPFSDLHRRPLPVNIKITSKSQRESCSPAEVLGTLLLCNFRTPSGELARSSEVAGPTSIPQFATFSPLSLDGGVGLPPLEQLAKGTSSIRRESSLAGAPKVTTCEYIT